MVRSGETAVRQQVIVVLLLLSASLTSAHQRSKQDLAKGATPTTLLQVLCSPRQALPLADVMITKLLLSSVQRGTSSWSRRTGVLQAWRLFCKRNISRCGDGKHLSPGLPTRGYIISLPEDAAARKHLEQTVHALGITTEHVPGVHSDQVFSHPFSHPSNQHWQCWQCSCVTVR